MPVKLFPLPRGKYKRGWYSIRKGGLIKYSRILNNCAIFALAFFFSSCYMKELGRSLEDIFWWRSYDIIIKRPVSEWNRRDCYTVMIGNMRSNLLDNRTNIKLYATPYCPAVIAAMTKFQWLQIPVPKQLAESDFESLLKETCGMYYDRSNDKLMDARGNYLKDKMQIDSVMFLITIENHAWMNSLLGSYMLDIPDITFLENQIFLINDENKFIKPKYVWGKRNNILTMPETLFAMFKIKEGDYSFINNSENIYLCVKGLETDIKLKFPIKIFVDSVHL